MTQSIEKERNVYVWGMQEIKSVTRGITWVGGSINIYII